MANLCCHQGTFGAICLCLLFLECPTSFHQLCLWVHVLPFISLLHLEGHGGNAVAHFADQPHDALAGQGGGLAGLREVGVHLQELPEVGVGPERGVGRGPVDVPLQSGPTSFDELEKERDAKLKLEMIPRDE